MNTPLFFNGVVWRWVIFLTLPALAGNPVCAAPSALIDYEIKLETISSGFDLKTCWVHPRAGVVRRAQGPAVVLTMQKLLLTGSDVFYALNEMRTDDLGRTWSAPVEHTHTLGRRDTGPDMEEVICDFTPAWHAATRRLLGIGAVAHYQKNAKKADPAGKTGYSVYDDATRSWSPWVKLRMPDLPQFYFSMAGCVQRWDLANGEILIPIYFKPKGEVPYSATVVRCAFDGTVLSYVGHGSELTLPIPPEGVKGTTEHQRIASARQAGLFEPSLTFFRGRYFLTLRNATAAYVSASRDGQSFSTPIVWTFDDGQPLGNYNTQQHWVRQPDGLCLVYTRRGANNDHVFRHRAPLFIAQVDLEKLCVIRASERVLVSQRGARLGNFGVTEINERESWVTVAEWMQATGQQPGEIVIPTALGADNSVYVARVIGR